MQRLHIKTVCRRGGLALEDAGSTLKELISPLLDLVGMDIELLRQFAKCLLTANRGKGNVGFECGCVIAPGSSCHSGSPVVGIMPVTGLNSTYLSCSNFPSHLLDHPPRDSDLR